MPSRDEHHPLRCSQRITSRLSLLECRVKPIRDSDAELLNKYRGFFDRTSVAIMEIDAPVVERAATLRVDYAFKPPDAIHLATAIENDANLFLTGDAGISRYLAMKVQVLQG